MVLNIDLNYPPHDEDSVGLDDSMNVNTTLELGLPYVQMTASYEPSDDEVIICSPRSFAEAVNKSRRNRRVIEVVDDETESRSGHSERLPDNGKRGTRNSAKGRVDEVNCGVHWEDDELLELSLPVPKPEALTFTCPVCMEAVVEETSTKCGHIFCKKCIAVAIEVQKKCPTCRRKLKSKDVFRIYLPRSH